MEVLPRKTVRGERPRRKVQHSLVVVQASDGTVKKSVSMNGAALAWFGAGLQIFGWLIRGKRRNNMLETIAVVLVVLWILGLVSSYTMGGFIHALLVIAIVVILVRVIQGRRV
jgi:hypothetical protein